MNTTGTAKESNLRKSIGNIISNQYMYIVIIALLIAGYIMNRSFFSLANIRSSLVSISMYGFLAISQAVMLLGGEINLTVGVQMAFAPIVSVFLIDTIYKAKGSALVQSGVFINEGWPYIVIISLIVSVLMGLIMGFIRIRYAIPTIITTLGMKYLMQGMCYLLEPYSLLLNNAPGVTVFSHTFIGGVFPLCLLVFIAAIVVLWYVYDHTRTGQYLYATGNNEKVAKELGVNTNKWKMIMFLISTVSCWIATLICVSWVQSIDPLQGDGLEFYSIAMALISGLRMQGESGKIQKVYIGILVLYMILNILNLIEFKVWYKNTVIGLMILFVAVLQMLTDKKVRFAQ